MSDTLRFKMPLLDAAQAQKHVTLNEALTRADILAAGRVEGRLTVTPPASPADGEAHIVAPAATGAWIGQDGNLALFLNGGWEFVTPWSGASFWVEAERVRVTFDGIGWIDGRTAGAPSGAATLTRIVEQDHSLAAGTVSVTPAFIPDKAVVLGVTGRVTEAITGATAWSLGVAGSPDRYGSGYGTALNAFAHGVSGQPQAYYGGTALEISADSGSFTAGRILLAVHYLEITPPDAA